MPVVSAYHRGLTGGFGKGGAIGGKRGRVTGWSKSAARNNTNFLRSVVSEELPRGGIALTLTLGKTPESEGHWRKLRDNWVMRLRRMGLDRWHWVTEWQQRGTPHLHLAVWFKDRSVSAGIDLAIAHWLELAAPYRAGRCGQHGTAIHDHDGWSIYLAKHCARGATHYQRIAGAMPKGWESSGRMWGKGGEWPCKAPHRLLLGHKEMYQLRRWMQRYSVVQALSQGDTVRAEYKRTLFSRVPAKISPHLGINDWADPAIYVPMVMQIDAQGGYVRDAAYDGDMTPPPGESASADGSKDRKCRTIRTRFDPERLR